MPCSRESFKMIEGIPHIPQTDTWDCGMACLSMAVRYVKPDLNEDDMTHACEIYGLNQNVWTIDLAYISHILGINHEFCTETIGVDKSYSNESFYTDEMKGSFSEEELRVNKRFAEATENGVFLKKTAVDLKSLVDSISHNQPAIVLTNDRLMRPHLKKLEAFPGSKNWQSILSNLTCCFCCWRLNSNRKVENTSEGNYWGHYVIVFGYDMRKRHFILHDPSPHGDFVVCDFTAFQEARTSYGTDGDVLFLHPT